MSKFGARVQPVSKKDNPSFDMWSNTFHGPSIAIGLMLGYMITVLLG